MVHLKIGVPLVGSRRPAEEGLAPDPPRKGAPRGLSKGGGQEEGLFWQPLF